MNLSNGCEDRKILYVYSVLLCGACFSFIKRGIVVRLIFRLLIILWRELGNIENHRNFRVEKFHRYKAFSLRKQNV